MTFEKPLAAGALDFGVDPTSTEDGGDTLPPFAPAPPRPSAPSQALAKLLLTDMSPPPSLGLHARAPNGGEGQQSHFI